MANDATYPRMGDRTPSACAQREEYWRRILGRLRHSGLSKVAFARREGLKENALNWWERELRARDGNHAPTKPRHRRARGRSGKTFVPVRVIEAAPRPCGTPLEIVTRGGHIVLRWRISTRRCVGSRRTPRFW